jgi:hypothetical protein
MLSSCPSLFGVATTATTTARPDRETVLDDAGTTLTAAATLLTALTGLVSAAVAAVVTLRRRNQIDTGAGTTKHKPPKKIVDTDQVMALAIEAEVRRRQAEEELAELRAKQAEQRRWGSG